ncbi:uncharacterized protein LOC110739318 [Chenopodium quinoa]|uniref:uncharacterized protein LOC110739318 n=1 Tax=Chenopodium quinoa TaxID=63459 RepID=UPI000B77AB2C|nr:uncharacterized protein LOC110739318 [Chenopodium quinoa]
MDEKWFYLNPDKRRFYLLPSEEDPYRPIQSKRFKLKAMFMSLIGKALYDRNGGLLHDKKYGMFPFTVKQLAKKSSKNREAGTWETKANNTECKQREFMAATTAHGFNIQFVFQPPQSPDLNVIDLGLFRSIQSLQNQSFPNNLDELVTKVQESYEAFNPQVEGGNKYKIPHMNKKKLENLGELPDHVPVQKEIVLEAVEYLNTMFRPVNQGTEQGTEDIQVDAD